MCCSTTCAVYILCFVWFGAISCILPFLSLHMRALGVPPKPSAFINGVLPLFQLVTFPFACSVAKRTASYKKATMWFLLFTAVATILLVFSPHIPKPTRRTISMRFQCGPSTQPTVLIDQCNHVCEEVTPGLSVDAYFTECHVDCPGKIGTFKNTADLCFDDGHSPVCHVVEVNNTLSEKFTFGMYLGHSQSRPNDKQCLYSMEGASWHQSFYKIVSCPIILKDSDTACALQCNLQEEKKNPSTSVDSYLSGERDCLEESPEKVDSAIWVYFSLRAVYNFVLATASILIERGMLHVLKTKNASRSKYGIVSLVASGVFTPAAGVFIELAKEFDVTRRYGTLIISCSSLILTAIILMSSMDLDSTQVPPITETFRRMAGLFKELEVVGLFVVTFLIGSISGFMETFLFWYLEDLSCPYTVMGATVTVGLIVGLPLSLKRFNSKLIAKTNRPGYVICSCFLLQSVRCFGYHFIRNYWWCLPLELIGALSFHLFWSSISCYGRILGSKKYHTAYETCSGALHYGLGRSCGALAGGSAMATFGFPLTFLGIGSLSGLFAVLYFLAYHLVLQKMPKNLVDSNKRHFDGDIETENRATLLRMTPAATPSENNMMIVLDQSDQRRESASSSTSSDTVSTVCIP